MKEASVVYWVVIWLLKFPVLKLPLLVTFIGTVLYHIPFYYPHLASSCHFHTEGHGKTSVDAHFSVLSRWLKQAEMQQTIITSSDLCDCLRRQARSHCAENVDFWYYEPEFSSSVAASSVAPAVVACVGTDVPKSSHSLVSSSNIERESHLTGQKRRAEASGVSQAP